MTCPNCNAQIDARAKFCPECGARLGETAVTASAPTPAPAPTPGPAPAAPAPAAPAPVAASQPEPAPVPAWAQTPPPPPPAAAPAPQWAQAAAPPVAAAPAWAQTPPPPPPQAGYQAAAAPAWSQSAPPPPPPGVYPQVAPAPGYARPAGAAQPLSLGPLLALVGGAVAAGSAWLAWMTGPGGLSGTGIEAHSADWGIANGYYLVGAGILAAACGVLMVLGLATSPGTRQLLAFGAIVGGAAALAVDVAAYMKVNDLINQLGGAGLSGSLGSGFAVGIGVYVGAAGGAMAAVGGLMVLNGASGVAGAAGAQSRMLIALILIAAIVLGGVFAWPQIQKQINGSPATPPIVIGTQAPGKSALPTNNGKATPKASFLTSGYADPEGAIRQWVTDQSMTYGGPCAWAKESGTFCSTMTDKLSNGLVYAVGAVNSEAQVFLLLVPVNGQYYVADVAGATGTPPWH